MAITYTLDFSPIQMLKKKKKNAPLRSHNSVRRHYYKPFYSSISVITKKYSGKNPQSNLDPWTKRRPRHTVAVYQLYHHQMKKKCDHRVCRS